MNILKYTWTYKFVSLFLDIYNYYKDKAVVSDVLYGEDFIAILRKYLNTTIRKDWIGRLYCIINPNIDEYGKFDISRVVIEFDNYTTHNEEYVKTYIYKQLSMVRDLFKLHKLYDYINMEIKHVEPYEEDNYLVIISLVSQNKLLYNLNKLLKQTILYIGIIALVAIICL